MRSSIELLAMPSQLVWVLTIYHLSWLRSALIDLAWSLSSTLTPFRLFQEQLNQLTREKIKKRQTCGHQQNHDTHDDSHRRRVLARGPNNFAKLDHALIGELINLF